jgi:hypothetical protein
LPDLAADAFNSMKFIGFSGIEDLVDLFQNNHWVLSFYQNQKRMAKSIIMTKSLDHRCFPVRGRDACLLNATSAIRQRRIQKAMGDTTEWLI